MKFKSPNWLAYIVSALITFFAILLVVSFLNITATTGGYGSSESYTIPTNDTSFAGIFETPNLDFSMPHNEYIKSEAEFNNKRRIIEQDDEGANANKIAIGFLNFYKIPKLNLQINKFENNKSIFKAKVQFLDSLSLKMEDEKDSSKVKKLQSQIDSVYKERTVKITTSDLSSESNLFYFGLTGYNLIKNNTIFFIKDTKNYLAFVKYDSTYKTERGEVKDGHYERKEIKPRYIKKDNALLLPINQSTYKFFYYASFVLFPILIALFSFLFIGLPIQVLLNIAKGRVFISNNMKSLHRMSLALLIVALLKILLPFVLHWIFTRSIPNDFEFLSFTTILKDNYELIIVIIIALAIREAFKKGYKLQQENALTI